MGKKTKKGKDKGAKAAADGVKVPRALRKFGDKALKFVEQPIVSEIAATALLAAAAALRDEKGIKARARAARDGGEAAARQAAGAAREAGREAAGAAREAGREAVRIGDALRTLALDLARRTLDRVEENVAKKASAPKKAPAKAAEDGPKKAPAKAAAAAPKKAPAKAAAGGPKKAREKASAEG